MKFPSSPHCGGDKAFEVISSHAGLQEKGTFHFQGCQGKRVGEKLETLITDKTCKTAGSSLQRGENSLETMNKIRTQGFAGMGESFPLEQKFPLQSPPFLSK